MTISPLAESGNRRQNLVFVDEAGLDLSMTRLFAKRLKVSKQW